MVGIHAKFLNELAHSKQNRDNSNKLTSTVQYKQKGRKGHEVNNLFVCY